MRKHICCIIFWGSLWGLTEATLGHALHIIPFNIGWMLWFPIAFIFMDKVYRLTGSKAAVLFAALVTALIKLVDLIAPIRFDYVLNPAVSIIVESLSMLAVLKIVDKYEFKSGLIPVLGINTCWRFLYIIYVLFLPAYLIKVSPISNVQSFFSFFIAQNIITSLVIYIGIKLKSKINIPKLENVYNYSPLISTALLIFTIYAQWVL